MDYKATEETLRKLRMETSIELFKQHDLKIEMLNDLQLEKIKEILREIGLNVGKRLKILNHLEDVRAKDIGLTICKRLKILKHIQDVKARGKHTI